MSEVPKICTFLFDFSIKNWFTDYRPSNVYKKRTLPMQRARRCQYVKRAFQNIGRYCPRRRNSQKMAEDSDPFT